MILLPPAVLWGVLNAFDISAEKHLLCEHRFLTDMNINSELPLSVLHVYPTIFTLAAAAQGAIALTTMLSSWSQTVRDKEFLLEMRLQNFETEQEAKRASQNADHLKFMAENDII
jgi:E3 ubiquitin-protein ligase MARCH6